MKSILELIFIEGMLEKDHEFADNEVVRSFFVGSYR